MKKANKNGRSIKSKEVSNQIHEQKDKNRRKVKRKDGGGLKFKEHKKFTFKIIKIPNFINKFTKKRDK